MPRRPLTLIALALVMVLSTGCANDGAVAVRVGDTEIGISEFQDELADWAASPTLVSQVGISSSVGGAPGSYSTAFANAIINLRVGFVIHNQEFETLGLELADGDVEALRSTIFEDPQVAATVFSEVSERFGDRLLTDIARQSAVVAALGDGYDAWAADAFATTGVDINPRYGDWDPQAGARPPVAPLPGPAGT